MKAIDEAWKHYSQDDIFEISHDERFMTRSLFEQAVKELLKLQREESEREVKDYFDRKFISIPRILLNALKIILNAELK